ncbi:hypothetical protein FLX56_05270 [Synechococcus moorigangaii CMS01]|nr:hypothetical protein [Synechococcus moorigangaii CMS01]
MKFFLFQTWLKVRQREHGFTIPVILGFGLFMTIVAITMIVRSSDDRANSIIQARTSGSIGIAEAGLSRSLSILNDGVLRNLLTRTYDPFIDGETVTYFGNSVATNEWVNPEDGTPLTVETDVRVICVDDDTTPSNTITVDLPDNLFGDDINDSRYRLLAYSYSAASSLGNFLIESTETRDDGSNAVSRLKAEIQVSIMKTPIFSDFPGILAEDFFAFGNNLVTVDGTTDQLGIVCTDCTVDASACIDGEPTLDALKTEFDIKSFSDWDSEQLKLSIAAPQLPPLPDPDDYTCNSPYTDSFNNDITTTITLPQAGHTKSADGKTYAYCIDDIDLSGSESLTINSSDDAPVMLFVYGDITMGGNTALNHTGAFQNLAIIGAPEDGDDVADQTWVLTGGGSTTNIFLYAPDAEFGINGGSGDPAFSGIIWIKTYGKDGSDGVGSSSAEADIELASGAPEALNDRFDTDDFNNISVFDIVTKSSGILSWERQEATN